MIYSFPDWSDLANIKFSSETQYMWGGMLSHLEECRYHFDGDVFEEKIPTEEGIDPNEEAPLLYPIRMNVVKMLCLSQTDAAFGDFDEIPFIFSIREDVETKSSDDAAVDLLHKIMQSSDAAALFWELELDRNTYGGAAWKISPTLGPAHIKWTRIPRYSFFPIWSPEDPDDLLEVYIITAISREQAKSLYNFETTKDVIYRVEHWTKRAYKNYLDDKEIPVYSGGNPWGIVPFVYCPRFRFNNWWGDDLTHDVIGAQNELNMRVADIGEAINYNSHPTRWGINLPRGFDEKNFPIGSNSMWDLGRTMSSQFTPEVGILEAQHAVKPEAFTFIDFIYDWTRTSVFAPPIAFGEDQGGGQRSGVTLEIRMWPLIKSIMRSRSYLTKALNRTLEITARILEQKNYTDVPTRAIESIKNKNIVPIYNPVLPQDYSKIVDQVSKQREGDIPLISVHTSQKELGRGPGEVTRIKDELKDKELEIKSDDGQGTAAKPDGGRGTTKPVSPKQPQ